MSEPYNPNVAILMATYNGGKYLNEQIESILNQTYNNFVIIIRDDGSNDNTVSIIQSYINKGLPIILLQNKEEKHGAYVNFWNLMDYAKRELESDFYFLSDQDDVWRPDKIQKCLEAFDKINIPQLIYTDMEVIDGDSNIIYPSYNAVMNIGKQAPQATFFTRDIFWGCTMAFNSKLLSDMPLVDIEENYIQILSHDTYIAEFASLYGEVRFIDKVLMKHRKHNNNVTGDSTILYNKATILNKIFSTTFKDKSRTQARTYAQSLLALRTFKMNGYTSKEASYIEKGIKKAGIHGVKLLKKYGVKKRQASRTILTYMIMITGSYKGEIDYWISGRGKS